MVISSFTSLVMFPSSHNLSFLSNALGDLLPLMIYLVLIVFNAMFLSSVSFVHRFISLEISPISSYQPLQLVAY